MAINELTKKEKIINFAQSDPFLKISDIAEQVGTTPRYVRTILSEANISLMKLRERYARNIEKRLAKHSPPELQAKVRLRDEYSSQHLSSGEVIVEKIDKFSYDVIEKFKIDDKPYRVYQMQYVNNKPYCLHELYTYLGSDVNKERLDDLENVYDLLGRRGIHHLKFMKNYLFLKEPDQNLLDLFESDEYLLTSRRTVLLNKIPIGEEFLHISADLTRVEFPGEIVI